MPTGTVKGHRQAPNNYVCINMVMELTPEALSPMKCAVAFTPTISAFYEPQEPIFTLSCLSPWKSWHPPIPHCSCVCMYVYISVRPSSSTTAYDGWHGTLGKATLSLSL
jgi:hypothetical protein